MDTVEQRSFGSLLKRYRTAARLTQEELAERAGLSARALSYLEQGARTPYRDTTRRLADALALAPPDRAAFESAARGTDDTLIPAAHGHTHGHMLRPLVGRAHELALLGHVLSGEGPPVLLLAGEPGIGKSRVLQEAAARAEDSGWRVLRGGCHRRDGQEPYAPLLGAIQSQIQSQAPAQLRKELRGCTWLVRLLPELATDPTVGADLTSALPTWTVSPAQEWRLMGEAVTRFLDNVAGTAGTLLVLDDLQWASADALQLLITVIRSHDGSRLRMVGAYRDTESGPETPLGSALADLAQAELVARAPLDPLTPQEATTLLNQLLSGAENNEDAPDRGMRVRERVLRRAGGVPFFLVSWAHGLRAGALEHDSAGDAAPVPWDLAQGVRQRLAALPLAAREIVGTVAIVGREAPYALLAAVVLWPEEEVLTALEAACRGYLLIEDADTYRFPHDVIREVVEAELGVARRAVLHRRVAEALERGVEPATAETLAYHFSRAGVRETAARYLEQAGDKARAEYAYIAAENHYRALSIRLDELGRARDAARAREKLGDVLKAVARVDDALGPLEEAARAYKALDDADGEGRVVAQIGLVHYFRGAGDDGLARLLPVVERLEPEGTPHGLALLFATLPRLYLMAGRHQEQRVAAERAYELARTLGDERLLAEAETVRGAALVWVGHVEDARTVLQEAIPRAEGQGDLFTLAAALMYMAETYRVQADFALERDYRLRALDAARRRGGLEQIAGLTCAVADNALILGDWDQARILAASTLAAPDVRGALRVLGTVCLYQGNDEEASHYFTEYNRRAEQSDNSTMRGRAHTLLAEMDLVGGHPENALARLEPLLTVLPSKERVPVLPALALAYLELGRDEAAHKTATVAVTEARERTEWLTLLDALRVYALVATRRGEYDGAARALEEGLPLARRMPHPYAEARLLHMYGQLCAPRAELGPARQWLGEALAIFQRLGARRDVTRVEQDIDALSQKPRHDAPQEQALLTVTPLTTVTDAQWEQIRLVLPPVRSGRGRPRAASRLSLEAILYKRRTGCAWANIPTELGDEATAHRRLQEWEATGVWDHIREVLRMDVDGEAADRADH